MDKYCEHCHGTGLTKKRLPKGSKAEVDRRDDPNCGATVRVLVKGFPIVEVYVGSLNIHEEGCRYISNLRVKGQYRMQGVASMIMFKIVEVFGHNKLSLNAHPSHDTNISKSQLLAFYRRFGFVRKKSNGRFGVYMERPKNNSSRTLLRATLKETK